MKWMARPTFFGIWPPKFSGPNRPEKLAFGCVAVGGVWGKFFWFFGGMQFF
jgi:hypothetical protein